MTTLRTAVIAGAGIAGTATAIALAKVGIKSLIVESHPAPPDGVGAIITVAANGMDALRTLGVEAPIIDAAQLTTEIRMSTASGQEFARYPGGGYVLPRETLARILSQRAAAAGAEIRFDSGVVGASSSNEGVSVHLADGTTVQADVLVGADGVHSTVRGIIDKDAPTPIYEGILGFGAATRDPRPAGVECELGVMNFAFGARFIGYWRLPDDRICWYASLPGEQLTWAQITAVPNRAWLDRLHEEYAGHIPGEALITQTAPEDLVATGPTLRMPSVPHWHSEHVVLVGDSVHAPSSSSGQGASLALESALELARSLRDTRTTDEAFALYERARRPRVEAIAAMAASANAAKAGRSAGDTPTIDPTDFHIEFERPSA